MKNVSSDVINKIEKQWLDRAAEQYPKPNSMAYKRAEVEYFTGAIATINALYPNPDGIDLLSGDVPTRWVIYGLTGRPIVDREQHEKESVAAQQAEIRRLAAEVRAQKADA